MPSQHLAKQTIMKCLGFRYYKINLEEKLVSRDYRSSGHTVRYLGKLL